MTTVTVRVRPRFRRVPMLKVHGVLAPVTALLNMVIFTVLMMWWLTLAMYLLCRVTYLGSAKLLATISADRESRARRTRQPTTPD